MKPQRGLFITGTDTGVGKTWIMGKLAHLFRQKGFNLGVWKPLQSGVIPGDLQSDSFLLKQTSGVSDDEHLIAPFSFRAPLAPMLAARLEKRTITINAIMNAGRPLFERYPILFVEGVGGLAVPINQDELIADLVATLQLPLLIIARAGLGTINHSLLTLSYAKEKGLPIAGIILNGYQGDSKLPKPVPSLSKFALHKMDKSEQSNAYVIEKLGKIRILGNIPYFPSDSSLQTTAKRIDSYLKISQIQSVIDGKNL